MEGVSEECINILTYLPYTSTAVLSVDVCQLLQAVVQEMSDDMCEVICVVFLKVLCLILSPSSCSDRLPQSSPFNPRDYFVVLSENCFLMPAIPRAESKPLQ